VLMPPPDGYEDGTQSFLSISQLQFGFEQLHKLGGVKVRTSESPRRHCVILTRSINNSCPLPTFPKPLLSLRDARGGCNVASRLLVSVLGG
jgi:hypothetical protein